MKFLLIVLIASLTFSCGESGSQKTGSSSQPSTEPEDNGVEGLSDISLTGATFVHECHFEAGTNYHVRFVDTYTASGFQWETRYYMDSECRTQNISEVIEGSYTVGSQIEDSVYELDYAIERYAMTFLLEDQIPHLNDMGYCGMTDWQANVRRELQGTDCGYPDDLLGTRYSSISIDGDTVHYTGPDEGSTPEERNTVIDWATGYQRM